MKSQGCHELLCCGLWTIRDQRGVVADRPKKSSPCMWAIEEAGVGFSIDLCRLEPLLELWERFLEQFCLVFEKIVDGNWPICAGLGKEKFDFPNDLKMGLFLGGVMDAFIAVFPHLPERFNVVADNST